MKNLFDIYSLVTELSFVLLQNNICLSVAESCTGGLLAAYLTSIPGCSRWFDRGYITYSNTAKQDMLGVTENSLAKYGAVSEEVVIAMAKGVLLNSCANVSIAISGIAGPDGGSLDKPVGTVWIAFGCNKMVKACVFKFEGDRNIIRELAVFEAIRGTINFVKSS